MKQESTGEYDETDIHRLIFAGDIPQDAFCERRSKKSWDISLERVTEKVENSNRYRSNASG